MIINKRYLCGFTFSLYGFIQSDSRLSLNEESTKRGIYCRNVYTRAFVGKYPLAVIAFLDAMQLFLSKTEKNPTVREELICILLWAMENSDKAVLVRP